MTDSDERSLGLFQEYSENIPSYSSRNMAVEAHFISIRALCVCAYIDDYSRYLRSALCMPIVVTFQGLFLLFHWEYSPYTYTMVTAWKWLYMRVYVLCAQA